VAAVPDAGPLPFEYFAGDFGYFHGAQNGDSARYLTGAGGGYYKIVNLGQT
jgi:hypothetical protein